MSSVDPLTPKQREISQRESRILDTAHPLIHEHGLTAVSMDAIARQMNVTRGTIYNHFPNKEDILLALATRAVKRRQCLFEFAIDWVSRQPGKSHRDACAAVGIAAEVYADEMPHDFAVEQAIRHDPVWSKTTIERRALLGEGEANCIGMLSQLIQASVSEGMLQVPRGTTQNTLTQQIIFGLWSLVYGGLVLESTSPSLAEAGIRDARQAIRRNCNALLDSLGWQPLYQPRSYQALVRRIRPVVTTRAVSILQHAIEGQDS